MFAGTSHIELHFAVSLQARSCQSPKAVSCLKAAQFSELGPVLFAKTAFWLVDNQVHGLAVSERRSPSHELGALKQVIFYTVTFLVLIYIDSYDTIAIWLNSDQLKYPPDIGRLLDVLSDTQANPETCIIDDLKSSR